MNRFLVLLIATLIAGSCSVKPRKIDYGNDQCAYCKMIIMDPRFGAELVTIKGKVYKYDAIECMVNEIISDKSKEYAYQLVNHFEKPGELSDATTSTFLISEDRPSPMGAFLSAYPSDTNLPQGQNLNWKQLKLHFENE